jgi:hypothetical protein
LVTTPPIPKSISTDSLTEETNVLGFFMPGIFRSRVPFSALAALRIHRDFARQPAGSGVEPQCAVLQAKSFVHGEEHRTQSELGDGAFRLKRHRAVSISRCNADPGQQDQSSRTKFS